MDRYDFTTYGPFDSVAGPIVLQSWIDQEKQNQYRALYLEDGAYSIHSRTTFESLLNQLSGAHQSAA